MVVVVVVVVVVTFSPFFLPFSFVVVVLAFALLPHDVDVFVDVADGLTR